ncbi:hypothetical protein TNCV_4627781 [Trichonephila clavipes]|nr:hypothetical protein TNCV_4627781 [Trichonephila clavipes]
MEDFVKKHPIGSRHLRFVSRGRRMNSYSNEELVDVLIMFGAAYCNSPPLSCCSREVIRTIEDLIAQIPVTTGKVHDVRGMFENVQNSLQRHWQAYQTISGHSFEHLL